VCHWEKQQKHIKYKTNFLFWSGFVDVPTGKTTCKDFCKDPLCDRVPCWFLKSTRLERTSALGGGAILDIFCWRNNFERGFGKRGANLIKQKCFFCGRSWFWPIVALRWRFQNSAGTSDVLCWVLRSKLFPKTLKRKGQKKFAQCSFLINQTKRAHWEKIFFEGGGTYDYIKFKKIHSVTYEFRNRTERCTNIILESKPGNFYSTCQDWMAS
jgi:hypothetical protein